MKQRETASETKLYWALGDRELLQEESGSSSTAESKSSRAVLVQIGKELRKEDDSQIPAELPPGRKTSALVWSCDTEFLLELLSHVWMEKKRFLLKYRS